ncbi:hypothetical protein HHI36_010133 [Cryptolaemus montrouzieri]|uniref:OAR domain-containing protein n=1 Tax=Cryptolaemus montrouzieri TaxID=559131 RepID=A0ABD2MI15_9CUCU
MHRKSMEAAEHLKEQDCNTATSSDHEESASMRTEASDTSATSSQQATQSQPVSSGGDKEQQSGGFTEDPEAFRNNSIACLRAKAQEHSAKLLNHNLLMHQVRQQNAACDANANNLMHQEGTPQTDTNAIF